MVTHTLVWEWTDTCSSLRRPCCLMRASTRVWLPILLERIRETSTLLYKVSANYTNINFSWYVQMLMILSWTTSSVPPIFHRVINGAAGFSLGEREGDEEDPDGTEGMVERREVVLGHSISLSCESNAIPPPRLSWYRQGRQLTSSDGVVLLPGEWSEMSFWSHASVN